MGLLHIPPNCAVQNKPNVLQHIKLGNSVGWVGTEISVFISGNWSTYKVLILMNILDVHGCKH